MDVNLKLIIDTRGDERRYYPVQPRYIINNANVFPVQTVDRAIQWINLFPVDSVIGLARRWRHVAFEQLAPRENGER